MVFLPPAIRMVNSHVKNILVKKKITTPQKIGQHMKKKITIRKNVGLHWSKNLYE